jgi:heat shock protein HslJ
MRAKTRTLITTVMVGGLLAAAAPATFAQSMDEAGTPLSGTSWAVTEIAGTPGSGGTLVFTDDTAGGFGGCNNFRAEYTADETALSFGPIASTMMACDEPVMAFEQSYLAAMAEVASYVSDGATLTLSDAAGTAVLAFAAQAPATLEGEWMITGYNNGMEAVVSPVEGTPTVITFGADGTVSGNVGCNQFSGGYSVDGNTIAIGPLLSTMMACEEPIMAQEIAVIAALDTATTWSISGDTAELRGPDDAIHLTLQSLAMAPFDAE